MTCRPNRRAADRSGTNGSGLHPIGVDTRRIEFWVREPRGRHFDILTVARLHTEKGIEYGLRAMATLIGRRPTAQVRYRIIGDGEDRDRLCALVEALGLSDVVEFLGVLPTPAAEVESCRESRVN